MKVVIVGGVAGGATAAARIRRLDERAEIVVFERSGYISYANCGLPYYVSGVIEDEGDLTLQTPEGFFRRFRIDARVLHEVTGIDTAKKCVSVRNLAGGDYFTESYDKLIIAPGAKPILPDFYIEGEGIFTLRTVEDALRIRAFAERTSGRRAVIVGGGFIGLEVAENLARVGFSVSVIQRSEHVLPTVDSDMASLIHAKLRSKGIELILNSEVVSIDVAKDITVNLKDGHTLRSDMVVVSVGVVPENALAKDAGIELGARGAIRVNGRMETSAKDVYAVGDAVEIKNFVTENEDLISLAGPANKQARVAADNIAGFDSEYTGAVASSVIKLFDMTVATTGISETRARTMGYEYEKIIITQNSHAAYYPGATAMTLKLIFEKGTGKILGASAIGYDGVDKRIDVIATAIRAGLSAWDLKELDLAYAPPYSSAKDPVNMLGFVADNINRGVVRQFYFEDIPMLSVDAEATLLDTRTPGEYARGHADGFINIPLDELRERIGELDNEKRIYVMCQSGLRSYLATRILSENGFDAYNFAGGYRLYSSIKNEEMLSRTCYGCGMDK